MRYALSEMEWNIIRPILPGKPRGIPRVDDRRVLSGIFWVLRSGAPWRDLPDRYGLYTTCYNRFGTGDRRARAGVYARPLCLDHLRGRWRVGFANYLLRFYADEKPRAVVVCWDTLREPNWRQVIFPPYQSGRVFDADLLAQLELLPEFVRAVGFSNAKAAGYEADDFLAAAVAKGERRGGRVIVASGDRDAFQLASAQTTIVYPVKAGEMARIGPVDVRKRYGVGPEQVPDFIALRGDPSDRIPGARGVGATTAASLLARYPSLESILAAGQFSTQADQLRLYRRIATMDAEAPLRPLRDQKPKWIRAAELARRWGLNALADRLTDFDRRAPNSV